MGSATLCCFSTEPESCITWAISAHHTWTLSMSQESKVEIEIHIKILFRRFRWDEWSCCLLNCISPGWGTLLWQLLSCSGVSPWYGWVYSFRRFLQLNRDVDLGLTLCLRRERKIYFCLSTDLEVLDSDCFMVSLEVRLVREKMKRRTASVERGKLDLQIQIAKGCRDVKDNTSGSDHINLALLSAFHPHYLAAISRCLPVPSVQAGKEANPCRRMEIPPGKTHLC